MSAHKLKASGKTFMIIVDDANDHLMKEYHWYILLKQKGKLPYVARVIRVNGKDTYHYLHWDIVGVAKKPFCIDHINHNSLDNRKENLRLVHNSHNVQNSKMFKNNTSGYRGVYSTPHGKWVASIYWQYKRHYIGSYYSKEEAAEAYNNRALELYGPNAMVNTIKKGI